MRCLFQSYLSCASVDMIQLSLILHVLVMSMMLHTSAHSYPFTKFPLRNNIDGFPKLAYSQNLDSSHLQVLLTNQDQTFEQRRALSMLSSTPQLDAIKSSSDRKVFPSADDVTKSGSILSPTRKRRRRRRQVNRQRNEEIISLPSSSSIEQKYKIQTRESEEIIIPSLMSSNGNSHDTRLLFPGQANYLKTRNGIPSKNPQTTAPSKIVSESDKISFPEEGEEVAKRGGWQISRTPSSNTKTTTTTQSPKSTQSNLQSVFFPDSPKSEEDDYDDKDNITNTSSFKEVLSKLNGKPTEDKQKQEHQQGENEMDLSLGFEFHSLLNTPDRQNKCRSGMQHVGGRCRQRHG